MRKTLVCSIRLYPHTSEQFIAHGVRIEFYAISWFIVVALLVFWPLTAWALGAVAAWTVSIAGALTDVASCVKAIRLPAWLAPWVPPEIAQSMSALLAVQGPAFDNLFQSAPALAGGLTVVSYVLWGIGSVLLGMLGAGLHLLIALWRCRGGGAASPNAGPSLAGR